ncbi:CGNR zinc finger domain-containing protein [Streptomyces sp. NBC_00841]|uniref:CGNR zinc finger domain-containing protein n=1 Tax=Streptomyces sp. NBC_00841 TaxID=2975847 RepID=UPI003FA3B0AD
MEFVGPLAPRRRVDQSHGGRREWCAMDPCGNRVKAAAHRARKKASKSRSSATASVSQ